MYCPVDGDEFRESITRCPEHDIDLVAEPPDLDKDEELATFAAELRSIGWMRTAFWIAIAGAVLYGVLSAIYGVFYVLLNLQVVHMGDSLQALFAGSLVGKSVALGGLAALAGGVMYRGYAWLRAPGGNPGAIVGHQPEGSERGVLSQTVFTTFLIFAGLWAATGIAVSKAQARFEFQAGAMMQGNAQPVSDAMINVYAVHYGCYVVALALFASMAAGLMLRAHRALSSPRDAMENSDRPS